MEWINETGETKVDENMFFGMVETDQGIYSYKMEGGDAYTADTRILIQKQKGDMPGFRAHREQDGKMEE